MGGFFYRKHEKEERQLPVGAKLPKAGRACVKPVANATKASQFL